jgi:zinc transport system substrate-binding protein
MLLIAFVTACAQPGIEPDRNVDIAPVGQTTPTEPTGASAGYSAGLTGQDEPLIDGGSVRLATPEPLVAGVPLNIVVTIFPIYDWVMQILGDIAEYKDVTLLINNRIDLHSFQPSVSDIATIATYDVFIHIGGDSDSWVDAVLAQAVNPDMVIINLMSYLCEEDLLCVESIEHDTLGSSCGSHGHHSHHYDDDDIDEHIWLSLRNAYTFVEAIAETLIQLDPELEEIYRSNLGEYLVELAELDKMFMQVVELAELNTMLFASRFPFRYMLSDYGIHYHAAFSGCSAESEASFSTIIYLTNKLDEMDLPFVAVTECSDKSIAETIISNSSSGHQEIVVFNSMQTANASDRASGISYLSIMADNLYALTIALDARTAIPQ